MTNLKLPINILPTQISISILCTQISVLKPTRSQLTILVLLSNRRMYIIKIVSNYPLHPTVPHLHMKLCLNYAIVYIEESVYRGYSSEGTGARPDTDDTLVGTTQIIP